MLTIKGLYLLGVGITLTISSMWNLIVPIVKYKKALNELTYTGTNQSKVPELNYPAFWEFTFIVSLASLLWPLTICVLIVGGISRVGEALCKKGLWSRIWNKIKDQILKKHYDKNRNLMITSNVKYLRHVAESFESNQQPTKE